MCIHIFARKRCLELFNLADTSNKTWWLKVEVKQIQPLIYMYYFSREGNEVAELLSKGTGSHQTLLFLGWTTRALIQVLGDILQPLCMDVS